MCVCVSAAATTKASCSSNSNSNNMRLEENNDPKGLSIVVAAFIDCYFRSPALRHRHVCECVCERRALQFCFCCCSPKSKKTKKKKKKEWRPQQRKKKKPAYAVGPKLSHPLAAHHHPLSTHTPTLPHAVLWHPLIIENAAVEKRSMMVAALSKNKEKTNLS